MCGINKSKKKYIVIIINQNETNPHEVKKRSSFQKETQDL